ncbi:MAG: NADH-quinone oxidoreductase subunit C [Acidimicrobiales bacterium]
MSSPDTDSPPAEADQTPVDGLRQGLLDALAAELGAALVGTHLMAGTDVWARVATDAWEPAGRFARDGLGLQYFCYLSVIDWLPSPFGRSMDSEVDNVLEGTAPKATEPMTHGVTGGDTRFQLLARLCSPTTKVGLTFKADVPDDTLTMVSWTKLFGGANWHEREAFEMFGLNFEGHPSLRKLYLPGEFEGYPMRKDFPLLSRMVRPWPGIVDVESMPGVADEEGDEA